jgi:hypothetical protein
MDVLVAEVRVPRTTADELHAAGAEVSRMLWGLMKTRMKKYVCGTRTRLKVENGEYP